MSARGDVASECWGSDVPDWVQALVAACDAKGSSQNKVAGRLGYTGAVVSQVIRKNYSGNMVRLEDRVRAIFLNSEIACPSLGTIGTEDCLNWRDRAQKLTSATPMKVRMFQACKACPRNAASPEEEEI